MPFPFIATRMSCMQANLHTSYILCMYTIQVVMLTDPVLKSSLSLESHLSCHFALCHSLPYVAYAISDGSQQKINCMPSSPSFSSPSYATYYIYIGGGSIKTISQREDSEY